MARTFGVIEGDSYAAVISAADRASKSADVRVVRFQTVGEHDVAAVLEGETGDIQLALDVAKNGNGDGHQLTTTILANTRGRLLSAFRLPRWF